MSHDSLDECVDNGEYASSSARTSVEINYGNVTIATHNCPECGREFEYIYTYQGIWDTEERKYVQTEPEGRTFTTDSWKDTGENMVVPDDQTQRYEHSWILDKCLGPDGSHIHSF